MKKIITSLFIAMLMAGVVRGQVVTNDLIGHWKMDNDWVDSINANNGTASGAIFSQSTVLGTHAGKFDGVNDYVTTATGLTNGALFSISFWINVKTNTDALSMPQPIGLGSLYGGVVVGGNEVSIKRAFSIALIKDDYFYRVSTESNTFTYANDAGTWRHIVVTHDSSTYPYTHIYKDGSELPLTTNLGTGNVAIFTNGCSLGFGRRPDNNFFLNGMIDDVTLYSRAISLAEITNIYYNSALAFATNSNFSCITNGGFVTYTYTNTTAPYVFTPADTQTVCQFMIVGGGGGGGGATYYSGGGGAGGFITNTFTGTKYIRVGGGGAGGVNTGNGSDGENSVLFGIRNAVGGGGGSQGWTGGNGSFGGSGGGGGYNTTFGNGFVGQGNNGGSAASQSCGGGGGGAGSVGTNGVGSNGGSGGAGLIGSFVGLSSYYAGGGGGCGYAGGGGVGGAGGLGGGGGGSTANGTNGVANTGGGGGGAERNGTTGGAGGSGIVIIRYAENVTPPTPRPFLLRTKDNKMIFRVKK